MWCLLGNRVVERSFAFGVEVFGFEGVFVEGEVREVESGWSHGRGGGVAIGKVGLNGGYGGYGVYRVYGVYRIEEGIGENGACGLGLDGIP